ncbi:MAG: sodium/proton antiporter [Methanomassiliicoccales archaeon PtaU1.Bin124]|nr:MAG: sodium/proton antiporter [Methanomassiliicoccales archaeon PtaU1.Bin124]
METAALIALLIFIPTYILISVRNLRVVVLDRFAIALLGAAAMVLLGVLSAEQTMQAIDLNTLALLLGMMLIVIGLEICGFFDLLAREVVKRAGDQLRLLVLIMVVTAVLSALILNDTVVLLFTPVVIKCCQVSSANPVPFLVAEAVSANIGSVATPVGNPQNAYIAVQSGLTFNEFFIHLFPVAVISLLIAIGMIWVVFRKNLAGDDGKGRRIDCAMAMNGLGAGKMDRSIYLVLGVLVLVFVGFISAQYWGMPLSLIALAGGIVVLFALPLINRKANAKEMVLKVDWTLLLFFIGLFVLLKGVEVSGLLTEMINFFQSVGGGGMETIPGLSGFCAILSNLISNVPAVMLLAPFVSHIGTSSLWLALAASSTLAGNATILGAAANVIVVEKASAAGVEVSLWQFVKAGLPITFLTLLASMLLLTL